MKYKDENIKGKEAKNKKESEKENLKPDDEKRKKDIEEAKKELACSCSSGQGKGGKGTGSMGEGLPNPMDEDLNYAEDFIHKPVNEADKENFLRESEFDEGDLKRAIADSKNDLRKIADEINKKTGGALNDILFPLK